MREVRVLTLHLLHGEFGWLRPQQLPLPKLFLVDDEELAAKCRLEEPRVLLLLLLLLNGEILH